MPPSGFMQDLADPEEEQARAQHRAQTLAERDRAQRDREIRREQQNADTAAQFDIDIPRPAPQPPGSAQAGVSDYDGATPPTPTQAGLGGQAAEGQLPQNPGIMFGGMDAGTARGGMPEDRDAVAQLGLAATANTGKAALIDPMAPEMFDPETGERPDSARKMGLLERMFGEKGSGEYKAAGRALMMAGAAIMSTRGNLGEAIGQGIQAGLMTYDQAIEALREEEEQARMMGMKEEAHAMSMHLQRLRASRGGRSGRSGSQASTTGLTPQQERELRVFEMVDADIPEDMARFLTGMQKFNISASALAEARRATGNDGGGSSDWITSVLND